MLPNAERVTFTKKKKTVACPVPLAPLADTHAHLLSFWGKEVPETLVRAKAAGEAFVYRPGKSTGIRFQSRKPRWSN